MPETSEAIRFALWWLQDRYGQPPLLVEFENANFGGQRSKGWVHVTCKVGDEFIQLRLYLRRKHGSWKIIRILENGEIKPMNPKHELEQKVAVEYMTAEDETPETIAWLSGVAAGRGLEVYAVGGASQPGEPLVLGLNLTEAPFPTPPESVTAGIRISGPNWLGAPWRRLEDDMRVVFHKAGSISQGVEQVVAQFSTDYNLICRYADAHGEFSEYDPNQPKMRVFLDWMKEHGTDHEHLLIYSMAKNRFWNIPRFLQPPQCLRDNPLFQEVE